MQLRPYQQDALAQIAEQFSSGRRAVLYQLPTGGGKTVIFSRVIKAAVDQGQRVCVLVHRVELLNQASANLRAVEVEHSLLKSGARFTSLKGAVHVASVQTLSRRLSTLPADAYDLLVVDEAHHAVARTWAQVLSHFDRSRILGVTATPCRLDGKGLGSTFQALVLGPEPSRLVADGFLAQSRVFVPPQSFDLSSVRTRMGDYVLSEAEAHVNTVRVMGDAVAHYKKHLDGGTAIAFCCSVAHAQAVASAFTAAGIPSASIDGSMSEGLRADLLAKLSQGSLKVLTSCLLIGEGVDVPSVNGCILLRPTRSLALHLQMVGRCLRPFGDTTAVVLDHVGNYIRHGHHLQHRAWSLEGAVASLPTATQNSASSHWICVVCHCVCDASADFCPECSHPKPSPACHYQIVDGELQEIKHDPTEVSQELWLEAPPRSFDVVLVSGDALGQPPSIYRVIRSHGEPGGVLYIDFPYVELHLSANPRSTMRCECRPRLSLDVKHVRKHPALFPYSYSRLAIELREQADPLYNERTERPTPACLQTNEWLEKPIQPGDYVFFRDPVRGIFSYEWIVSDESTQRAQIPGCTHLTTLKSPQAKLQTVVMPTESLAKDDRRYYYQRMQDWAQELADDLKRMDEASAEPKDPEQPPAQVITPRFIATAA